MIDFSNLSQMVILTLSYIIDFVYIFESEYSHLTKSLSDLLHWITVAIQTSFTENLSFPHWSEVPLCHRLSSICVCVCFWIFWSIELVIRHKHHSFNYWSFNTGGGSFIYFYKVPTIITYFFKWTLKSPCLKRLEFFMGIVLQFLMIWWEIGIFLTFTLHIQEANKLLSLGCLVFLITP